MTESESLTERVHVLMTRKQKEKLDAKALEIRQSQGAILRQAFFLWLKEWDKFEARVKGEGKPTEGKD